MPPIGTQLSLLCLKRRVASYRPVRQHTHRVESKNNRVTGLGTIFIQFAAATVLLNPLESDPSILFYTQPTNGVKA